MFKYLKMLLFILVVSGCDPVMELQPSSGPRGAREMVVEISGEYTHFDSSTTAKFDTTDIEITNFTVNSETSAQLTLNIPDSATEGTYVLTLTTSTPAGFTSDEVVDADFTITPKPSIMLDPATADIGATAMAVAILGTDTTFDASTFSVDFDIPGVTLGPTTVIDATNVQVIINVASTAIPMLYPDSVHVYTDYQEISTDFELRIPRHIEINPASGVQGEYISTLTVTGFQTAFNSSTTMAFSTNDIIILSSDVLDATTMELEVYIDDTATPGLYTLSIDDGGTPLDADFTIFEDGFRPQVTLTPDSAMQWESLSVQVQGIGTHFIDGVTTLSITPASSGVTAVITNIDDINQTVTLDVDVDFDATPGVFDFTFTTYGEHVTGHFTVIEINPDIVSLTPNEIHQGEEITVTITGIDTHWNSTDTTITIPGLNATILSVSPTQLTVDVAAPDDATIGARTVSIATGTEIVTGTLNVTAGTPDITLVPDSVEAGQSATINVSGRFVDFINASGLNVVPENGCNVSIEDFGVTDTSNMWFTVSVPLLHSPGACSIRFENAAAGGGSVSSPLTILPGYSVIDFGYDESGVFLSTPVYYSMTLTAGEIFKARANQEPGSVLDIVLSVAGSDADFIHPLASNDDESYATWDSLLVFQAPHDGTYYLRVSDRLGINSGYFHISYDEFIDFSLYNETEPNDTLQSINTSIDRLQWGRFTTGDTSDCYSIDSMWDGKEIKVSVIARSLSPYAVSGAKVRLSLYNNNKSLTDTIEMSVDDADPVLFTGDASFICVENLSDSDTFYFINITPPLLINEVAHYEESGSIGNFVEITGEPDTSLAGCQLVAEGETAEHGSQTLFSIPLMTDDSTPLSLTSEGYLVIGHDTIVPGTGGIYIKPALEIPTGYTTVSITLQCEGNIIDEVCYGTAGTVICTQSAVLSPSGDTIGRGFKIDTDDMSFDFISQTEPSPWEENLTEVSQ